MPKSLDVSPDRLSQAGTIVSPELPVYQYRKPLSQEREIRGDAQLIETLRYMLLVREFEQMLHAVRSTGRYEDLEFAYRGPAHLSVGQEAAAVGAAMALTPNDHMYGNHRSHGEFIAKGLAAIASHGANHLTSIMETHAGGDLLRRVEQHLTAGNGSDAGTARLSGSKQIKGSIGGTDKSLAENFLLLGLLSEIFMRSTGFNGGMGGSMHAFFPPFGIFPNNAIVGGSAGIACGAALYKKIHSDGIAVATSGDGSTACGPVWEAMNFASMAQYRTLWEIEPRGGLPMLFLFINNFYAMGGQTIGETMGWDRLARIGAGVNAQAMHAETVDGTNPLAVADAVSRQRDRLMEGNGPALLDIECYRYSGHSTSDANAYRSREELKAWQAHDPIVRYSDSLVEHDILTRSAVEDLGSAVRAQIYAVTAAAINPLVAPIIDIPAKPLHIGDLMFNNSQIDLPAKPLADLPAIDSIARIRQNTKKARHGLDADGKALSPMRAITLRDALFEPILQHMLHDDRLIAYGEECREWGGAFGVYRGLADLLPHHRLFNAPISEACIVATAVGYALEGGRSLVELMYADFIGRAGDEIFNQMAKWQSMSGGTLQLPLVLRCSVGSKYGAQHSQDWSSLLTHIPGLKIVYPATPYDAKGLMASALSANDPVVFFESQRLYDVTEQWHTGGVPAEYYRIALGEPSIKRHGDALTLLTIGPSLFAALSAAETLASEYDLQAEIIDARSLVPFNYTPVLESLARTGHLLIVSESSERGSFSMTLANTISRYGFKNLKAAVRVLGAPNWIVPGAEMENSYFPQPEDIIDIVTGEFYPQHQRPRQGSRVEDDLALAKRGL